MSERERMTDRGVDVVGITAEEFAAATPDVPAERIRCTECSTEFVGDRAKSTICPSCRTEMGIGMFPEGDA